MSLPESPVDQHRETPLMNDKLFYTGLGCVIAALVGGGLKVFDIDFPVFHTLNRQLAVGLLGILLVEASFAQSILNGLKSDIKRGRGKRIAYAFLCFILLFMSIAAIVVVS